MLASIVTGPIRGLLFIADKVNEAVQQEMEAERDATMAALRQLHLKYEAGGMDEETFGAEEDKLLARLEQLE